jgi:flagella basal body P-ring formation protein FlgA
MRSYGWLIGICFAFLAAPLGAAGSSLTIKQPEKATVVGPQITLGEIADVVGTDSGMAERVRHLVVGRAAPAGNTAKVVRGYIKIMLRREGFSLADFDFEGVDTTEVLTKSQLFSLNDLLPSVKAFVLKEIKESPENVEVKIEGEDKKITLPAGNVDAKFRPSFSGRYDGTVFLTTEMYVDGHFIKALPLRLTVDTYHAAVVTTQRVEKGEKFTAENTALVKEPSSKIISGCFRDLNNVLGRTAAYPLVPDTVIRVNEIYDPPMIRHGQTVEAVVQSGNIELLVDVMALEDGKAGDMIRVENTQTHKVLRAKVVDEKKVLVDISEQ